MPAAFARRGVEGEHAIGEQIRPDAIAAPVIVGGRAGAAEDEAALDIEREAAPRVGAADGFPRVGRPRLVTKFAGVRDGVENPAALPGADIERADVARRRGTRTFADDGPHDDQIAVDHARCRRADGEEKDVLVEAFAQVDEAAFSKARRRFSGRGIEAEEMARGGIEDAAGGPIGPIREAAIHAAGGFAGGGLRIKLPQLAPRRGVERDGSERHGGEINHAVDHERIALDGRAARLVAGVKNPRRLELPHVLAIDLLQRGKFGRAKIAAIDGPAAVAGGRRVRRGARTHGEHGENEDEEPPGEKRGAHGVACRERRRGCQNCSLRPGKVGRRMGADEWENRVSPFHSPALIRLPDRVLESVWYSAAVNRGVRNRRKSPADSRRPQIKIPICGRLESAGGSGSHPE